MSEPDTSPHSARDFPLVFTEGEKRFVFTFKDEGVTLDANGLAWRCEGRARARPYGEITGIRLRRMPTPGGDTGQCRITFSDGETLNVMSWTPAGFPDAGRAAIYRNFIAALHGHLPAADRARIAFTSGFPGAGAAWQKTLGTIVLVAVALLFVVTPLGVALIAGDPKGYALAAGGAIVAYGLYWKVQRGRDLNAANKPQSYPPDQVPAALLP